MTAIDFEKLTDDDALAILKNEFEPWLVDEWRNEIESAADVFWYTEAYADDYDEADLMMAIQLQGWDKSLPEQVHQGLVDSHIDLFETSNTHDLEAGHCPSCESKMWCFTVETGRGWSETESVTEYGEIVNHYRFVGYMDGRVWDANHHDDDAAFLCDGCRYDLFYRHTSSVSVNYGDIDKVSGFDVDGDIVRWQWKYNSDDNYTDLHYIPGDATELAEAVVQNNRHEWFSKYNWESINREMLIEECEFTEREATLSRRPFNDVLKEWAEAKETHPDIDYTYIIDETRTDKTIWVQEELRGNMLVQLEDAVKSKIHDEYRL